MSEELKEEEKRTKGATPRIEFIVAGLLIFVFLIWVIPKCNRKSDDYELKAKLEESSDGYPDIKEPESSAALPLAEAKKDSVIQPSAPATPVKEIVKEVYTPLYVTVEAVNVRKTPSLKGQVITRLNLYDEVKFMNETTDFKQEVKFTDTTTIEPWIKIQTQKGQVGWIYGACLHYYKVKKEGLD